MTIGAAASILKSAKKVVALTGAGVSAESGIPTFRASDGLWCNHKVDDVATLAGFKRDPELVWKFYNERRASIAAARPNAGHLALAEMQSLFGVTVITQNIDGFHKQAGSKIVLEMHGCLARVRCDACGTVDDKGWDELSALPVCDCGVILRPDVVWFGESLSQDLLNQARQAVAECDALMVIGTTAIIYPVAGLIRMARSHGAKVIEFNLTETSTTPYADVVVQGKSGITLPALTEKLYDGSW